MNDPAQPTQTISVGTGIASKEVESPPTQASEVPILKEVGHEAPLSQEVAGAGVKIKPTTVTIPPKVSQMGVKTVGQTTPLPATTVSLPLSDDQIAAGLHQNITSSWRWLAEWCRRRLKQAHLALNIHGKIMRVRT